MSSSPSFPLLDDGQVYPPDPKRIRNERCVNNNCPSCHKEILGDSQLHLEQYREISSRLDYKVPRIWPFKNEFLHKSPVFDLDILLDCLLSPSSKMLKLVAPPGFGKTQFINFCRCYFRGEVNYLDDYPALRAGCLGNISKYQVIDIDLKHCASLSISPSSPYSSSTEPPKDLGPFTRMLSAQIKDLVFDFSNREAARKSLEQLNRLKPEPCFFLDHFDDYHSSEVLNFLNAYIELQLPFLLLVASTPVAKHLPPSLTLFETSSCSGYTLPEIQIYFGRHLVLLKRVSPFKDSTDDILTQIAIWFKSWDNSLFIERAGHRAYPFSLINQLMLTGELPSPPQPTNQLYSALPVSVDLPPERLEELTKQYIQNFFRIDRIPSLYDVGDLKQKLGTFYKCPLPQRTNTELDLRLLGVMEWMHADSRNETYELLPHTKTVSTALNGNSWILLGPSGCGKTRVIFDVATQHPVIFINCVQVNTDKPSPGIEDHNYILLFNACKELLDRNSPIPDQASGLICPLIHIQLCCRMLLLLGLLSQRDLYSPANFLLLQLNGGQKMIRDAWQCLSTPEFAPSALSFARYLLARIRGLLPPDQHLTIALDEASVAASALGGTFLSPSRNPRGFLTPLTYAIIILDSTLPVIYAGTGLSLAHGASIESDILKPSTPKLLKFPILDRPFEWLDQYLDLGDCSLTSCQKSYLSGRFRIATSIIQNLPMIVRDSSLQSKAELLNRSIEWMIRDFTDNLRRKLDALHTASVSVTLRTIGLGLEPLLFYYYNNDQKLPEDKEIWITSATPLDGYANQLLRDGIIFLEESSANTQVMRVCERLVADFLCSYFVKFDWMPNHSMMIAWLALSQFEARKWSSSAGGFAMEQLFKAQFHIHQTQKQTLKQAFAGFDGLPEWMENDKLRFELHLNLNHGLSDPLPFFQLFATPSEYGPDVFLVCKVDDLWYCISGAIKFFGGKISKELRYKNWAAANPGLMFHKFVSKSKEEKSKKKKSKEEESKKKKSKEEKSKKKKSKATSSKAPKKTSKTGASGDAYAIERFICPDAYSTQKMLFHKYTENAFNWYDQQLFNRAKLGGAIVMNALFSPSTIKFEELPLPANLPIVTLKIDWSNYAQFFLFENLRDQLAKVRVPSSQNNLVAQPSSSTPDTTSSFCNFPGCQTKYKGSTSWFACLNCSYHHCTKHPKKHDCSFE